MSLILFDDIEAWAVEALQAALDARDEPYTAGAVVATTLDGQRPTRAVTVRRDGGGQLDAVREQPRLGINIFAPNDIEAASLGRLVAALLWASPDGDPVCKVTITSGPYKVTEASTASRYYLTAELISRGRNFA